MYREPDGCDPGEMVIGFQQELAIQELLERKNKKSCMHNIGIYIYICISLQLCIYLRLCTVCQYMYTYMYTYMLYIYIYIIQHGCRAGPVTQKRAPSLPGPIFPFFPQRSPGSLWVASRSHPLSYLGSTLGSLIFTISVEFFRQRFGENTFWKSAPQMKT